SALYHVQRIHGMTGGLRVPVAWPHDGTQHDKGSGLPLAGQYRNFGANMNQGQAVNHGTTRHNIEPPLEEMPQARFAGNITNGSHNTELIEELRNYHRDEDFRIVKQRDDLVSALRYAIMMRRLGKSMSECDGVGYGNLPYAGQRRDRSAEQTVAKNVNFDVFTGAAFDE